MEIRHDMARSSRACMAGIMVRAAAALALLGTAAYASACPTLTTANVIEGNSRFLLDDEGYAAVPWNLQLEAIGSNGSIAGSMTTNVYGGTLYPVSGTVTGTGTLEISFSYTVEGPAGLPFTGVTYQYSGAIVYADSACDEFIAGTYTSTTYSMEETRFGVFPVAHTSAPMPFSGQYLPIFY